MVFSFAFYFSILFIFLSFQRVLENDENVEEGNEEEDLEEDIPKRKNRTRGRVSWDAVREARGQGGRGHASDWSPDSKSRCNQIEILPMVFLAEYSEKKTPEEL